MQTFIETNRLGWLLTGIKFLWTVRSLVTVLLLLGSLLGYFVSELISQRQSVRAEFSKSYESVLSAEAGLRSIGEVAFQTSSRTGEALSVEIVQMIDVAAKNLISALALSVKPTGSLAESEALYVRSLRDLRGIINQFNPGEEGTIAVLKALIALEKPADDYGYLANQFKTSVWVSFWSSL